MIAIIDYDAGNIKSVEKAMQFLGQEVKITERPDEILAAEKVILPGVGAFGDAMRNLKERGLDTVIYQVVEHRFLEFVWGCSFCLSGVMRVRG